MGLGRQRLFGTVARLFLVLCGGETNLSNFGDLQLGGPSLRAVGECIIGEV